MFSEELVGETVSDESVLCLRCELCETWCGSVWRNLPMQSAPAEAGGLACSPARGVHVARGFRRVLSGPHSNAL